MEKLTNARGVWLGGIWSGILAGVAMALFMSFISAASGGSFLQPMALIAAVFFGNPAQTAVASSAAAGLALHLFISAVFGLVFATFIRYSTIMIALILGVCVSVTIWAIATFAVLPLLDPPLWRAVSSSMATWFLAHLLFGAMLSITPAMVVRWSESSPTMEAPDTAGYDKAA